MPKGAGKNIWIARIALLIAALLLSIYASIFPKTAIAAPALPPLRIEALVDDAQRLGFDDILLQGQTGFAPLAGQGINLGFGRRAVWLRLRLESPVDQTVLLSLTPNFVDEIDVHIGEDRPGAVAADFRHLAMGDNRPLIADGLSGLANVVPVALRADREALVYIRAAAVNSALGLTVSAHAPSEHALRTTVFALVAGLWFGGMAILVVIQLVFFHYDRKPWFILLAFSTFMAAMVYAGSLGISRLFLFPHGGTGNDLFTAVTAWLGISAGALAASSILDLPAKAPRLHRAFLAIAGIGLVGVGFALAGHNLMFGGFGNLTSIALVTLAVVQALRRLDSDGPGSGLRAAGFGAIWLGILVTCAQRVGVVSLPEWGSYSYGVGVAVHSVLMTASLGVRLRAAETLNRTLHEQALVASQSAEARATALAEERTWELAEAKRVAEAALQAELASQAAQVRFMEIISHQYRTPLATIRTYVDSVGLSLPCQDSANRQRLDRVRGGIRRLVEVLEVNLSRSRLTGPFLRPDLAATPPAAVIEATVARAQDLLQIAIVPVLSPEAEASRIPADAGMLGIALINLLENAAKYARPGAAAPVHLRCDRRGSEVIFTVEDRGIGIPPAEIGGIFGPGARATNAGAIEGTGAGLSLVSRIAAAHGGRVEIDSTLGQGTTVRIILPAGETPAPAAPEPFAPAQTRGR